jgi:hypothetical protein
MVMTDKEQTKLVAALQNPEHDRFPLRTARDAAVEIERLRSELEDERMSHRATIKDMRELKARLEALERM